MRQKQCLLSLQFLRTVWSSTIYLFDKEAKTLQCHANKTETWFFEISKLTFKKDWYLRLVFKNDFFYVMVRVSVSHRHHFLGNCQVDWHQIWVKGTKVPYLHNFFSNFKLKILDFFLRIWLFLIKVGLYGREKFKWHLRIHMRFTSKKSWLLLWRVSTKVVERIVKFQIWIWANFFFRFR